MAFREVEPTNEVFLAYTKRTTITAHTVGGVFTAAWDGERGIEQLTKIRSELGSDFRIFELNGKTVVSLKDKDRGCLYDGHYFLVIDVNAFEVKNYVEGR